jgi:DNA-binding LytR/AlgR family response regulator
MPYIVIVAIVVIALVVLLIIKEVNITIREYKNLNYSQPYADDEIRRNKNISEETKTEDPNEEPDNKYQITTNFPVKIGDKVIFIKVENIVSFTADNIYVNLNDIDCNKYLLDNSLSNLELRLPINFIRIHRSTIINRNLIKEIHKYLNGRFALFMKDKIGTKFISGQSYAAKIKELIEI